MEQRDLDKLRVGSLVQYTHIGRHEDETCIGVIVSFWESGTKRVYADVRWFDGASNGEHNMNHGNLSLISA